MSLHDRAVDHVEAVARLRRKGVKDPFPNAAPGPAVEAIVGRRIRAVALGQIPPRHSGTQHVEDRVHDLAVIRTRALAGLGKMRLQMRPFPEIKTLLRVKVASHNNI